MAKVTLLFGNEPQGEVTLDKPEMKVGRAADCDIVVDNLGVSRHHCSFVHQDDQWKIVDKGSNNGTFMNGQRVGEHLLKHQDRVVLGKFSLIFDAYGVASAAADDKKPGKQMPGSEMTMFVDPAAIAKMQAQLQAGGGGGGGRVVLSLMQGGREVRCPIVKQETLIGAGAECDVPVKGFLVKPVQAKVFKAEGGHKLIAQGGFRSVRINGRKVKEAMLNANDIIVIAGVSVSYKKI